MPLEIELKARVPDLADLRRRLSAEGARVVGARELEDNWLLDEPGRRLLRQGENLRVRVAGGRAVLTWKGPKSMDGALRSREELELGCDDAPTLLDLFSRLGFRPTFRYQKFRETWELGEAEVMVDETPAGVFVEVEGAEAAVRAVADRLRLPEDLLVAEGYPALFLGWLRARGSDASELLFAPEDAGA